MTTATLTPTDIINSYFAAWNEMDPARRAAAVAAAWTPDGHYADPSQEARGYDEIGAMTVALQERFAGHRIQRTSGLDEHHGEVRFGWNLAAPDGSVIAAGIDIGVFAEDGRLKRITGFFGDLPARE